LEAINSAATSKPGDGVNLPRKASEARNDRSPFNSSGLMAVKARCSAGDGGTGAVGGVELEWAKLGEIKPNNSPKTMLFVKVLLLFGRQALALDTEDMVT
jgi:hypothetical protein